MKPLPGQGGNAIRRSVGHNKPETLSKYTTLSHIVKHSMRLYRAVAKSLDCHCERSEAISLQGTTRCVGARLLRRRASHKDFDRAGQMLRPYTQNKSPGCYTGACVQQTGVASLRPGKPSSPAGCLATPARSLPGQHCPSPARSLGSRWRAPCWRFAPPAGCSCPAS